MTDPNVTLFQESNRPLNPLNRQSVRITHTLLFFDKGTVSTTSQQVPLIQIEDVDALQSMAQKVRGVGSVRIMVRRPTGIETVMLEDFTGFQQMVRGLNEQARQARLAEARLRNTQHVQYQSVPGQAAPSAPAAVDPIEQIERLGRLRDSGVISEEEFTAKKNEWLARM